MGSCLSAESRNPPPDSPPGASKKKRSPGVKVGPLDLFYDVKEEQLHKIPGRIFLNGSSEIASIFTQQGKKGTNQDTMIVWENFCSRADTVFCAVFDGHGPYGHMVARRVRNSLPLKLKAHWEVNERSEEILNEICLKPTESTSLLSVDMEAAPYSVDAEDSVRSPGPECCQTLKESFLKAFKVMDKELRMHANFDCHFSGTTAVVLVKQGRNLVIGNVGDSRAVLASRDENNSLTAVQLTVDLKPDLPGEKERIQRCRGRVFALRSEPEVARVWLPKNNSPGLAMARAFGDLCLKEFGVISVPDVSCRHITDSDEFVVLATDGIWDVLSNEEVANLVASCPTRSRAARTVVEAAIRAWRFKYPTSKIDDCAVVCLFFDSKEQSLFVAESDMDVSSCGNDDLTSRPLLHRRGR